MSEAADWLLRRARITDGSGLVDIAITGDRIAAVGPDLSHTATHIWDLESRVVLPGLVDLHTHLDKTFLTAPNLSGTLLEAIEIWRQVKLSRTYADFQMAARRALQSAIANGVTAMRSHVDTEHETDLVAVEALLDLRQQMRHQIDLQLVALGFPGNTAENDRTMATALEMGVDLVGAAPAITPDPTATIDAVFALAERFGRPIDLHIDETEDPQMMTLSTLAQRTLAHGMQGSVTAGHCCSLAFADAKTAAEVIEQVAAAGIHVVTLPLCNLVLMGRGMHPVPRGVTRSKELLQAGVNVSAASDNVHDPFNPFGSYDLLQIASLHAAVAHMTGEQELYMVLEMVTANPAQLLGIDSYGIHPGATADLVILDTERVLDAVTAPPPRLATFKEGRRIVHTTIERVWG
jgi:cytosine/creatinine deaminase